MGLFSRKESVCTLCNKSIKHKNKAKREWGVKSPLCTDCYLNKMKESYDASIIKKCADCGIKKKVTELWEPRWQWDMEGLLCKKCFDEKELDFATSVPASYASFSISGVQPLSLFPITKICCLFTT